MNGKHSTMRIRPCLPGMVLPLAIFLGGVVGAGADGTPASEAPLRLVSIKPTVLFTGPPEEPLQLVEVTVENGAGPVRAELDVTIASASRSVPLGTIEKGISTVRIPVPDTRHPTSAQFTLKLDGETRDTRTMPWRPHKHWTVYFIPITHHDLGYTDTIENVLNRYAGFYDDVLRFCEETEDWPEEAKYRYTLEGSWSIQHFVANRSRPAREKLAKYIKAKRIEVGALFGNEISGLCGHEELIRLMYPSFRFKGQYGAEIRTGSITDVPGLSWGLPTVMAGAGVKYFFAGLPTYFEWGRNDIHTFWDEAAILRHGRPDAFRWQGPDGQSVLVYYQSSYGFFKRVIGPDTYQEVIDHLPGMLADLEDKGCPFDVMRYIHNGVDNYPPDVKISHIVRQWNSKWTYPKLIVATNTMFFEALEKQCRNVRTFRGELPHTDYVVGAISTAQQTSLNRLTHDKLLSAETAATIASLVGDHTYPADPISDAYDNMLLYDEHTWGKDYPAGEAQDWGWNEKSHYAYKAAGLAQSVLSDALRTIADRIRLEQPNRHLVVFNPLSFVRTDVVRVARFSPDKPFRLIDDETGRSVPYQMIELDGPHATVPYAPQRWGRGQFEKHELFDLVFVADSVPPVGYKTYRLAPTDEMPQFSSEVSVTEHGLENRFFKVTLDPRTGAVASIYDKDLAQELVDQQASDKLNQLVAKWVETGKTEGPTCAGIHVGQSGSVCASLVARGSGPGCPQLTQEVVLYSGIKRIDLLNRLLKDSRPLMEVYFAFPFKVDRPQFRFEGSNCVIEPLRDQFPGSNSNYYAVQHWAQVSNPDVGVTLSPIESHLLEFGGLWPCYVSQAHHGFTPPGFGREFVTAEQLTKGHMYAFVMDSNFRTNFQPVQQGDMLFRYSLTSSAGATTNGRCRDFGWSAHRPLIGLLVYGRRDGTLGRTMSFCQVDAPNVLLTTIKRAEDGHGVIVRLIESDGKDTTVTLTLPHVGIQRAWRTNPVEENQARLGFADQRLTIRIPAFGIATLRLETY